MIAFSAHALAGQREKALAAGCNEFDTKPIEFDRLVATFGEFSLFGKTLGRASIEIPQRSSLLRC